jgi:hypothetical protein
VANIYLTKSVYMYFGIFLNQMSLLQAHRPVQLCKQPSHVCVRFCCISGVGHIGYAYRSAVYVGVQRKRRSDRRGAFGRRTVSIWPTYARRRIGEFNALTVNH